jgi:hypothetical protein
MAQTNSFQFQLPIARGRFASTKDSPLNHFCRTARGNNFPNQ